MIVGGLASISFRKLNCREVANLAKSCGLQGIEWIGDAHAPAGNVPRAKEALQATKDAGLKVAGYGSYFRPGERRSDLPEFAAVLETAVALETPLIRAWAGLKPSAEADAAYRAKVVADLVDASQKAKAVGIRIGLEYHVGTLTDADASALALARELQGTNVQFYWQAHNHDIAANVTTIRQLTPRLANFHVFQTIAAVSGPDRRPLAEGSREWLQYLRVPTWQEPRFALLEFVRGDSPEQLAQDAAVLNAWLAEIAQENKGR